MITKRYKSTYNWILKTYTELKNNNIRQVAYVPDAGHKQLIELFEKDKFVSMIPLTSEQEGVGLLAGAWLGGERGVLLMQSSGVGNCINAISSIITSCNFPLLITMRGEWNEFNPWQVPMGSATSKVLSSINVQTITCKQPEEVAESINAMAGLSYKSSCATGVLFSQQLIGAKSFKE